MGLQQEDKAVFYHPLNDKTEHLKSQDWTESTVAYVAGQVSNALGSVAGDMFGTESEFLAAAANYLSIAVLSATKFVVVYRDGGDSNNGTAKIGTISGTNITFGAEAEFLSTGAADIIFADALSSTKFVVVFRDNPSSDHGTAMIGEVSGTNIIFGAEAEFVTAPAPWMSGIWSVAALDVSNFVVAYNIRDTGDAKHGEARIGVVTGTTISFGPVAEFLSALESAWVSVTALDASKIIVVYDDESDGWKPRAKVGTVSGTDITYGADTVFSTRPSGNLGVTALSASKFVVVYYESGGTHPSHGFVRIGSVSGTDITFGTAAEVLHGNIFCLSLGTLSESVFVVAYRDQPNGYRGKVRIGTVSGTDAVLDTPSTFGFLDTTFLADAPQFANIVGLSESKFAVVYQDDNDAAHGKAKIGTTTPGASSLVGSGGAYNSAAAAVKVAFSGWFKRPSG